MALLLCPDCGGAVSSRATACPGCGYRRGLGLQPRGRLRGRHALAAVTAYALVAVAMMYAFPSYAVIIGGLMVIAAVVELRSGLVRRVFATD